MLDDSNFQAKIYSQNPSMELRPSNKASQLRPSYQARMSSAGIETKNNQALQIYFRNNST